MQQLLALSTTMTRRALVLCSLLIAACSDDATQGVDSAPVLDTGAVDSGRIDQGTIAPDAKLPQVDWCGLHFPPSATITVGASLTVYGRVHVAGETDQTGARPSLEAQLGHGPSGTDGSSSSDWTWASATFNVDAGNNDEYQAELSLPKGSYAYSYRFRLKGGPWTYCDADGSADGYSASQQGSLTVTEAKPPKVDWCKLQYPPSGSITVGSKLTIFGQAYVAGVTDPSGQGASIEGQVGYGPSGSDGSTDATWTWQDAIYNKDDGGNDEYQADLTPAKGAYAYAYRFRYQGGSWLYCDLDGNDGSAGGYSKTQQGGLMVTEAKPPQVSWCNIQSPATAAIKLGGETAIYGQVLAASVTEPSGQGPGVVGQIGFGPVGSDPRTAAGWTWGAATYHKDVGNNDEYQAMLSPTVPGSYAYVYRFRIGAQPDFYCDLDGNDGSASGFDPQKLGKLDVKPVSVDWCNVQFPSSVTLAALGKATVYGQVLVDGVTDLQGQGADIEGQLGYGTAGTDGSTSTAWTWAAATYHKDDGRNDEYQADLSPAAGKYVYAFRFRLKSGPWLYCDLDGNDGSSGGYAAAAQGTLTVAAVKPTMVDWCNLQFPSNGTLEAGTQLKVYGQVYVAGTTEPSGQGAQVEGQLGYGAVGTDGSTSTAWVWQSASFNVDSSNNDEYVSELSPAIGSYEFAYRFRFKGGEWRYCDLDGNDGNAGGYTVAQQGKLVVSAAKPPTVDWCRLEWPPGGTLTAGDKLAVYGQVLVAGKTDPAGQGAEIDAQLGYGPSGSDGSTAASWKWSSATYNKDVGSNDEYHAELSLPVGSYEYAYRFRYQGGPWRYCDLDGNDGTAGGYAASQQGSLTVKPVPTPVVDWCNLQWPASVNVIAGTPLTAYGQVLVTSVTESAGQGANVEGQLGYGPPGSNGSTGTTWTWQGATYHLDANNNDEYAASVTPAAGIYSYAYRFRYKGGSWRYCDLDGSSNGFDAAQQGTLTVTAQQAPWVQMVSFSSVENVGARTHLSAEIYLKGVTDATGQGAGISAQLGYGPVGVAPTDAAWVWQAADYEGDAKGGGTSSNDVYGGWLIAPAKGSYDVAIKLTSAGQDYYADLDGTTAGYQAAEAAHLTTFEEQDPPQNDIGWCNLQWPASLTLAPGASAEVYAQVYVQGITDHQGGDTRIVGELGVGPAASDPRTAKWTWTSGTYNTDVGNNDELKALLVAPQAQGAYRYVFRFRYQTGWTYCDTDGSNGKSQFDPAKSGALTVQ